MPARRVVSPPWVLSPSPSVRVQKSPSQSTAETRASTSSCPGEVTRRTWNWPVLRPSRTTRLRRKPRCSRRSQAPRPCADALGQHLLAQLVAALGGEHAVRDGDDAVEAARLVEAAHQLAGVARPERVLELVAVAPLLERGDDRVLLEALQAPDAAQRVGDLLGLDLELALVREHLPRRAGMVGGRRDPVARRLQDLDGARLGVRALRLPDHCEDAIAGHGARDEDHVAVLTARDAVAAVGERLDGELELVAAAGARGACSRRHGL